MGGLQPGLVAEIPAVVARSVLGLGEVFLFHEDQRQRVAQGDHDRRA